MNIQTVSTTVGLVGALFVSQYAPAQVSDRELQSISTPDSIETPIGTLEFFDGVEDFQACISTNFIGSIHHPRNSCDTHPGLTRHIVNSWIAQDWYPELFCVDEIYFMKGLTIVNITLTFLDCQECDYFLKQIPSKNRLLRPENICWYHLDLVKVANRGNI